MNGKDLVAVIMAINEMHGTFFTSSDEIVSVQKSQSMFISMI